MMDKFKTFDKSLNNIISITSFGYGSNKVFTRDGI